MAISLVGMAFFFVLKLLGGFKEIQNATDASDLNIAKQALRSPAIAVSPGIEQNNFSGLVDANGLVNLLTYNRLVGQTLLVALNAQAEATSQSKDHAASLIQALQGNSSSLGGRLKTNLSGGNQVDSFFSAIADKSVAEMFSAGSVRFQSSDYQAAFMKPGGSTNVFLDPSILPTGSTFPSSGFSSGHQSSQNFSYVAGYAPIDISNIGSIAGAPVFPGQAPHLVSCFDFNSDTISPVSGVFLPPNAFMSTGQSTEAHSGMLGQTVASAIVGALDKDYAASIPRGYLVITNPAGFASNGETLPNPDTIFNNELFTGIWVADNGAFSTDMSALQAWVTYNNAIPTPARQPATDAIFGADPHTIMAFGQPMECDYTTVSGSGAVPACAEKLTAFEQAYPHADTHPGLAATFTAVELVKANVMALFPNGGTPNVPNSFSGIRLFTYNQAYPVAAGHTAQFTQPGTIGQYLAQIGNGADTSIIPQLKQRIREIKPSATSAEIDTLLASHTIDLGETFFIYLVGDSLVLTATPPPWLVSDTSSDGNAQTISSDFQTIGYSVDPPGEAGFTNVIFQQTPNPSSVLVGHDRVVFTPSSGFNNLLGTIEFREQVETPTSFTLPPTTANVGVPLTGFDYSNLNDRQFGNAN
jgi:hypothetical protein